MEKLPVVKKETFDFMVPETYERALEIANGLAKSGMVPKHYQNNPTDIIIAMSYGAQLGISPVIALNGIAVINGAPSLWGKVFWGIIMGCPALEDFKETWEDNGNKCKVQLKRKGIKDWFVGEFSMDDAKRAGLLDNSSKPVWKNYPKDMVRWKARHRAGVAGFSDYLCGLGAAEDVDVIDVQEYGAPEESQPKSRTEKLKAELAEKPKKEEGENQPATSKPAEDKGQEPIQQPVTEESQDSQPETPSPSSGICGAHGEEDCEVCNPSPGEGSADAVSTTSALKEKVKNAYNALPPANKRGFAAMLYEGENRQKIVIASLSDDKVVELDKLFVDNAVYAG